MSAVIEDIGRAFEGAVRNVTTVLALIAGVAVLSFVLPYLISLTQTTVKLAGGAAGALPAAPTT